MSGYSVLAYQRTPNASNADLLDLGTFDTREEAEHAARALLQTTLGEHLPLTVASGTLNTVAELASWLEHATDRAVLDLPNHLAIHITGN